MSAIEIKGLDELIQRMQKYPQKLRADLRATMDAAMLTLWENVPPYPDVPNPVRKGTLGRTLGSSQAGGKSMGQPDSYEVRPMGSGYEGRFGTNLEYAPRSQDYSKASSRDLLLRLRGGSRLDV